MMNTICLIILHIDAALQAVYGGTLPAALQEKYQELTAAMTVDSKVFFYNADALLAMTSYEIDLELTCAPKGTVAETFLYQAIKLHSNAAWHNLELQAADLAESPDSTDRDWAELFSDELYDCGYVKASLKYCRWKEEH
jgi:hypothetical protein